MRNRKRNDDIKEIKTVKGKEKEKKKEEEETKKKYKHSWNKKQQNKCKE